MSWKIFAFYLEDLHSFTDVCFVGKLTSDKNYQEYLKNYDVYKKEKYLIKV